MGRKKGKRIVHREADLAEALSGAKEKQKTALMMEEFSWKIHSNSRHIEVKIFGGQIWECSSFGERNVHSKKT
ncbi:MAG: hypothetical protein CM15mP12_5850 [Gammaproteobacteria bacterium]|nr:MAG: hypothetical protein CM15mP12_5850 [Gammaproteobacteria bacterium]